jgi:hypothetical protein
MSGTAKDVTGVRRDLVETKLAQLRVEEHESLIQKATVEDVKKYDPKTRRVIRAVPMEDIYLCHQRIDNTRLRRNRSYACLIGLASALAVLGGVIWSFPRRTTRATKDPL